MNVEYGFKLILTNQTLNRISSRVTLLAESEEYTSVPEFQWPFILLSAKKKPLSHGLKVCFLESAKKTSRPKPTDRRRSASTIR